MEIGDMEDIEKYSKQTVKVTKKHTDDCKKLLQLMGVPIVQAPSEAEAQCAVLCKSDKVYAMASEDMDSLAFGAPRFLRHLMEPVSRKVAVVEFEMMKVLEDLNLSMDQFIDVCILSGCDYCESIRGIGGQTALKLIRQHGSLENVIDKINKQRYRIPDDWEYQEARQLFKEPSVVGDVEKMQFQWNAPDEEGLLNFLVGENGFKGDRVVRGVEKLTASNNKSSFPLLHSSVTRAASLSTPIKTKVILGSFSAAMKPKSISLVAHARLNTRISCNFYMPSYFGSNLQTPISRGFSFAT